jgi:hypothetical protein
MVVQLALSRGLGLEKTPLPLPSLKKLDKKEEGACFSCRGDRRSFAQERTIAAGWTMGMVVVAFLTARAAGVKSFLDNVIAGFGQS